MIAFVRGNFIIKSPAQVIVDVNGVGYELQISLNTYTAIANSSSGQLSTYLHITENAQTLFGFHDNREKELFLQLISVSGVGASTARMMLSGMKPDEIVKAIVQGNVKQLESIKGIGKKTAERLIVELKDKLSKGSTANLDAFVPQSNTIEVDALNALTSLGIGRPLAEAALKKALKNATSNTPLEELIRISLKNM
ncbi:Holliday junction branch migration protein RuvA [Ilyomonas limi]|uniref:Holliday junction branch migration complex subunit RuvA n=1 Tax=Ilyomonas limi TaxID=2575867 RepID=A0A4V5UVY7_9BACT|nr:Holliday junction branch migration protein RuvA [Ilyomonas limi]TKK69203.1 Holliday junction branch migration protein RuvA [Ilyomonas limi]